MNDESTIKTDAPSDRRERLGTNNARGDLLSAGWGRVVVGLIILAMGTFIVLVSADVIRSEDSNFHAPRWVVGVVGVLFATAGLMVMVAGMLGARRTRRLKARSLQHPNEPWMADHGWHPRYSRDEGNSRLVNTLMGSALLAMFAVPFVYVGFFEEKTWPFALAGSAIAVAAVGFFGYGIYLAMRRLKYGGGRIEYDGLPQRLGETLEVRWVGRRPIGRYNKITFTLRCVKEEIEEHGSGEDRSQRHVRYQIWADTYTVDGPGEHFAGEPIALTFLPPADAPPTELRRNPPRYWEIEIHADTPGVDFHQIYLVPVYGASV